MAAPRRIARAVRARAGACSVVLHVSTGMSRTRNLRTKTAHAVDAAGSQGGGAAAERQGQEARRGLHPAAAADAADVFTSAGRPCAHQQREVYGRRSVSACTFVRANEGTLHTCVWAKESSRTTMPALAAVSPKRESGCCTSANPTPWCPRPGSHQRAHTFTEPARTLEALNENPKCFVKH